ncbi:MAG TPA: peptide ABC transporter substrate-binding protein, partial [Nitrosomonas sp.]|nr:peptide ABC transporter substrate-binding protein [Nitrosomonas sp.]
EWGWNADYPDPENFFFLLYGPQSKAGNHSGNNAANYDNPEYNQLFERMEKMDNGPERQAIIDQMVEILRYDAPWLWGYHPKDYALYHAWFQNVKPNKMSYNNMKYLRINAELRERKQSEWNQPVLWPIGLAVIILMLSLLPGFIAYRQKERKTETKQLVG